MNTLQQAIIETVLYADLFDFALSIEELYTKLHTSKKINREFFVKKLEELIKRKNLVEQDSFVALTQHLHLIELRKKKIKWFDTKLSLAKEYLSLFSNCPWVIGIFVSGSMGAKNPVITDDIDLLIVTEENRLWLTRLWLTVTTEWYRIRRRPLAKEFKDQFCLNLFLDSSSLSLENSRHTLPTAYEITQLIPLYDPFSLLQVIFSNNKWFKQFMANFEFISLTFSNKKGENTILTTLNSLAFYIQKAYMKKRHTREEIKLNKAYFHPEPLHDNTIKKFYARKKQMGLV